MLAHLLTRARRSRVPTPTQRARTPEPSSAGRSGSALDLVPEVALLPAEVGEEAGVASLELQATLTGLFPCLLPVLGERESVPVAGITRVCEIPVEGLDDVGKVGHGVLHVHITRVEDKGQVRPMARARARPAAPNLQLL